MAVYKISFSPTGGTDRVLDILEKCFGPGEKIDLMKDGEFENLLFEEGDLCLVGAPVFAGRIPATAAERLSRLRGRGARAVAVAVYGNRAYEDALLELRDSLAAAGFRPVAGIAANAEHSVMHRFGTGRPDAADRDELREFARQIMEDMERRAGKKTVDVPGVYPYKPYGAATMIPKAGESCIGCGVCAERCPVGAIPVEEPSKVDESSCICCMACVAAKARQPDPEALNALIQRLGEACSGRKENRLFL